jgi:exosortase family protein XrtF
LKEYFFKYKPFLQFLAKFFLAYIVLTVLYQGYLRSFSGNTIDGITKFVANNTQRLLSLFDATSVEESQLQPQMALFYKQKYVARIIEGCNGISIIVLFIAFVIAFSGKVKTTFLFIIGGSLIIYVLNVVRIAILSILMYHYPEEEIFLHGVVFPLIIYGTVFILWVIWVNKFSKYATKNTQ